MEEPKGKNIKPPVKRAPKKPMSIESPEEKVLTPVEIQKSLREKKSVHPEPGHPLPPKPGNSPSYRLFTALLSIAVLVLILIFVSLISLVSVIRKNEAQLFASSSSRDIEITSTTSDADVYVNNHYIGITPLTLYDINLNKEVTIRVRKAGLAEYKMTVDKFSVKPNYLIVLGKDSSYEGKMGENTGYNPENNITWSDFGLKISATPVYTESLSLASAKCKDVKTYLKNPTRCKSDNDTLSYNAKVLSFSENDKDYKMNVKLPDSTNDCKLNTSKCKNAKKLDTVKLLDQNFDVYQVSSNNDVTTFLQPIVKNDGDDYNSFYLEFTGGDKVDYKTVLNMISKNA